MNISESIFRAYDIRGVVTDVLTPEVVHAIGQAFGSECAARGRSTVVIGRDGRLSGPALADALAEGLVAAGREVIDIGQVPTPVLYFATHELQTGTGIMVTGSHNPPEYNGLKMMIGGDTLFGDGINALYRRLRDNDLVAGEGSRRQTTLSDIYSRRILEDIRLARPLRIAVDCGNGVAGSIAPDLLRGLGCEVTELYCEVDGTFPNHHPDPSKPENLRELIATVTGNGLDLGLAFDGDGDRVGVVDDSGEIIWADRQMMLYSADVLSRNPGATIIYDVKCTRFLADAIREAGGQPLMWKTGHSFIKAKIRETGALLGGEMSGHIFFKERWLGFDDALYAAARLLEILAAQTRPTHAIFAELPNAINTPELNVHFDAEGENFSFMQRFAEHARFEGAELTTIDGVRADFADGWGLVRASNTTPSLVIRFEADNEAALQRIQNTFRDEMKAASANIELPF